VPGPREPSAIIKALKHLRDTPDSLRSDAFQGGAAPSAISRGAEGVTTFPRLDDQNGSTRAVKWVGEELARELKKRGTRPASPPNGGSPEVPAESP
jgi:hypothetical protein